MDAVSEEQTYVDRAYSRLDSLAAGYTRRLAEIRREGGRGNPEQLFQRDSFAADYEDHLARLSHVEHQLVLGRLDSENGDIGHIGRIGLRDEDRNVILLDWRAPQAEPFYQATALNPQGMVRRRHIQSRLRRVVSVEDELLTSDAEATANLNLTGEGALMASLGSARQGHMSDIVATIQAEQDRIIRADSTGVLIVQGGPGTGKTAVALHRAAYLLYAHRNRLANSGVLILGPSSSFLSFISRVLPSLGESDVVSSTIADLLPGIVANGIDSPRASEIKGRAVWARVAKRAVEYLQRPLTTPVTLRINSFDVELTPDIIATGHARARRSDRPHNEARQSYARAVIEELVRRYLAVSETEEQDWLTADIASNDQVRRAVNLCWLPATPTWLLEHLYAHPALLKKLAPELSDEERAHLHRPRGSDFTQADIPILDELAELLGDVPVAESGDDSLESYASATIAGMDVGGGIVTGKMLAERQRQGGRRLPLAERAAQDRTWAYGHAVVDEAQELSPLAWRMVARRVPSRSLTIVGDLDQRPSGAPDGGWRELLGPLASHMREEVLTISYRTPAAVLEEAEAAMNRRNITLRHPVRAVRKVDGSLRREELDTAIEQELEFLETEFGPGQGLIAIISENPPIIDHPQISTMTPREAKGLEFDSVIIDGTIVAPGDLYVAMTRPTQHLIITPGTEI
ncbi:HelD family protein [Flaviflexus huanghaiensis]|uniref:HelD family protein n=1 Tax=Flaviflexus huanghaiensis TaxID=1111473 RepID=UPI001F511C59|nr:AAA family ATPase [Flaviflexus huanghaiensis]